MRDPQIGDLIIPESSKGQGFPFRPNTLSALDSIWLITEFVAETTMTKAYYCIRMLNGIDTDRIPKDQVQALQKGGKIRVIPNNPLLAVLHAK